MSALERDFLKAKLGKLPLVPPNIPRDDDSDDEREELQDAVSELGSVPSSLSQHGDLSPISASSFFDQALSVRPPHSDTDFRVYYTPPKATKQNDRGVLFVMHHGAVYSGLSFCRTVEHLSRLSKTCGYLAIDARGHGKTESENPTNHSLDQMATDLASVLHEMFPDRATAPKLILVGHSMGGPVVVTAASAIQDQVSSVLGVAMLDIAEGTAVEAFEGMRNFIARQPKSFQSVEEAISWLLATKTVNNADSLRISVPSILVPTTDPQHKLRWKTDLTKTEPYWSEWFAQLSKKFLNVKAAKLLVLAGTDRLDTELMIGQMQGKYQLVVIPESGHSIQEDTPARLAQVLYDFLKRNEVDTDDILRNVKKVGQHAST